MLTLSVSHLLWLSDAYERDLVEVVLEVAVSQISQRQRDMLLRQIGVLLGVLDSDIVVREIGAFNEYRWVFVLHLVLLSIIILISSRYWRSFCIGTPFSPPSTRLVLLVSGGPGRPPLSGRSVAFSLRNKLRKQKNDFLIFKARRVDTVSTYGLIKDSGLNSSDASFLSVLRCFDVNNLQVKTA